MKPLFITLLVSVLLLQMIDCGRRLTPDELFLAAVFDGGLPATRIINASQQTSLLSGDTNIWIHFKISPEDYKRLWSSETFVVHKSEEHVEFINKLYTPPSWWNPDLLGAELISLECEVAPHFGRDRSVKEMFVNQQRTEVFFLLRNWYNY